MNDCSVPGLRRGSRFESISPIAARMGTIRTEARLLQRIILGPAYALRSKSVMQLLPRQLCHISQWSEKRSTVARLHHQIRLWP